MNYYEVAILKSPLQNLTYQSEEIIENGSLVEVILAKVSCAVLYTAPLCPYVPDVKINLFPSKAKAEPLVISAALTVAS